jgi:xanthine dehydrogenase accessory factor
LKKILQETIRLLENEKSVVWATVVDHKGSTPRKTGSRILIGSNGVTLGSIGGGRIEAEALETAKTLHQMQGSLLLNISMTGQEVAQTEMICGGHVKIYVELLSAGDLPFIRKLYETFLQKKDVLFLTWIDNKNRSFEEAHYILDLSGKLSVVSQLPHETIVEVEKAIESGQIATLISHPEGEGFLFLEPLRRSSTLYIYGGGHISLDLAWMAERVGFQVIVVDDRKAFANRDRFPMALDVWVVPYKEALKEVELGYDDFVVIVTRGHLFDLDVLREVIVQSPEYIGMIGSRRKKAMIFGQLQKEGISQKKLDAVHAPIGLDIKAETPAEISISIIAEMIMVRAESRGSEKKNWHV